MKIKFGKTLAALCLLASGNVFATAYTMPNENQSLIGQIQHTSVGSTEKAAEIAHQYDIGYNAIEYANPTLNMAKNLSYGTNLQIPTKHLLPNQPRRGIVVNLPEMRMYYYVGDRVYTYPIGIGKIGKTIPITRTSITRKTKDPIWIPPEDIREFNMEQGIVLPRVMPAGPDNPLGPYAIYMKLPTFLMHSTIFPESIGKRASFGCIRMYESDIKEFFPSVSGGIPVAIINSPTKIGWENDKLYLESHVPLEEHGEAYDASLPGMVHIIANASKNQATLVDWQLVSYMAKARDGIPHEIGMKLPAN